MTDTSGVSDPAPSFAFPDVHRRWIGATMLILLGVGLVLGSLFWQPPRYSSGLALSGVLIVLIGIYIGLTVWRLGVDEAGAVEIAASAFDFALGPASISIGWRGIRSRPVWRILAYSHEAPPKMRGLAEIDAVDGRVLSVIQEENPENWGAELASSRSES